MAVLTMGEGNFNFEFREARPVRNLAKEQTLYYFE